MKSIAVLLALLALPFTSQAQILVQTVGDAPRTVSDNSTFTLNLELVNSSDPDIVSYSYALEAFNVVAGVPTTPASGVFTLENLSITSTALTESNAVNLSLPAGLNPQVGTSGQPTDLGAITPDNNIDAGLGTGTFNLETLTLGVNSNAQPGTYVVEFYEPGAVASPIAIYDDAGNSVGTALTPLFSDDITIGEAAVPEPSTWAMLFLGSGMLVYSKRRLFLNKGLRRQ